MKAWKKAAVGVVSVLTIAGGANLAAMAAGSDDSPSVVDVKGPCDELEHANDAQCAGPQVLEDNGREREPGDDRGREQEQRGREDENEAGDDRGHDGTEDSSGPGSQSEGPSDRSGRSGDDDGENHDRGDDRGENSGHDGEDDD